MVTDQVTADPAIMAGAPVIRDTRITVSAVLGHLAAGLSLDALLASFPTLSREDVLAALAFAAESMPQERSLAA